MTEALLALLPIVVGVVLSPLAVVAVILMLLSPRAPWNALSFLSGWIIGLAAVGGLVLLLVEAEQQAAETKGGQALWAVTLRIALGAALLYLAYRTFGKRPRSGAGPRLPGWMRAVDSFTPARSLGVAAVMAAVKPKNLLLTIGAMIDLALVDLPAGQTMALFVVFVLGSSLGIGGPVVYALAGGEGAMVRLGSWRTWLVAYNATLVAAVLAVLGAKVLIEALSALVA